MRQSNSWHSRKIDKLFQATKKPLAKKRLPEKSARPLDHKGQTRDRAQNINREDKIKKYWLQQQVNGH